MAEEPRNYHYMIRAWTGGYNPGNPSMHSFTSWLPWYIRAVAFRGDAEELTWSQLDGAVIASREQADILMEQAAREFPRIAIELCRLQGMSEVEQ